MVKTMYQVSSKYSIDIVPVDVIKETPKTVVYSAEWRGKKIESRSHKSGDGCGFFLTWEDARAFILAREQRKLASISDRLRKQTDTVARVLSMKNPEGQS